MIDLMESRYEHKKMTLEQIKNSSLDELLTVYDEDIALELANFYKLPQSKIHQLCPDEDVREFYT